MTDKNIIAPSEAQIRKLVREIAFGSKIHCPECHSQDVEVYYDRYRCRRCQCRFSLLSHTYLKDSKLSLRQIWTILWFYLNKTNIAVVAKYTGLSGKSIAHWYDTFRLQLSWELNDTLVLSGIIQADETYFGKRPNDTCLLMAKQVPTTRQRGLLCGQLLPMGYNCVKTDVIEFLKAHVITGSTVYTDRSPFYGKIDQILGVKHIADNHFTFQFDHTSQIEGTFGNLKPFIKKLYGRMPLSLLRPLVLEFVLRYNNPEIFADPKAFLQHTLKLNNSKQNVQFSYPNFENILDTNFK